MGPKEPFELGRFCLLGCASARPLTANVTAAMIVKAMAIALDDLRRLRSICRDTLIGFTGEPPWFDGQLGSDSWCGVFRFATLTKRLPAVSVSPLVTQENSSAGVFRVSTGASCGSENTG